MTHLYRVLLAALLIIIGDVAHARSWYLDADRDRYGNRTVVIISELQPIGYVTNRSDCDDSNRSINPGAVERLNWLDDDCDRSVDESCSTDCDWDYESIDADSLQCRDDLYQYWLTGSLTFRCTDTTWTVEVDADGDGYRPSTVPVGDCDDFDATINPEAPELQDWRDNDCVDGVDNGCSVDCGWDYDTDYWHPELGVVECRDDLYVTWLSGFTDFTWECQGEVWYESVE